MDHKIILGYVAAGILGIATGMWLGNRKKKAVGNIEVTAAQPVSGNAGVVKSPQIQTAADGRQAVVVPRTAIRTNRGTIKFKQKNEADGWNDW